MCPNLIVGTVARHRDITKFSHCSKFYTLLYHYNIWKCLHRIANSYLSPLLDQIHSMWADTIYYSCWFFKWMSLPLPHLSHGNSGCSSPCSLLQIFQRFFVSCGVKGSGLPDLISFCPSPPQFQSIPDTLGLSSSACLRTLGRPFTVLHCDLISQPWC